MVGSGHSHSRWNLKLWCTSVLWFCIVWLLSKSNNVNGMQQRAPYTEEERRAEYYKRGHTWPIPNDKFIPNTQGWTKLMNQRFAQVRALTDSQMKWDGWIETLNSAIIMQNYTQYGWGLTRAPESLTKDIRQAIFDGLPTARSEGNIDVIDGPAPLFIDRPDLTQRALRELQPILEAWSGIDLLPSIAYGFRLYRNESRLWMHIDRTQTHVISCIYHLASSDNAEPWPIVIEDFEGNTNSVILKPGDILLYESAKNWHGRPRKFNGDWYTSLFVHFYPNDPVWYDHDHEYDSHFAIPPDWERMEPSTEYPNLQLVGTSMLEPDCPDSWCHMANAIEWEGPGEYGKVLTGGGQKYSLDIKEENDNGAENSLDKENDLTQGEL